MRIISHWGWLGKGFLNVGFLNEVDYLFFYLFLFLVFKYYIAGFVVNLFKLFIS